MTLSSMPLTDSSDDRKTPNTTFKRLCYLVVSFEGLRHNVTRSFYIFAKRFDDSEQVIDFLSAYFTANSG